MRIINKLRKAYSKLIVCQLWVHWFNPIYTLYFNFIFFPLRQAIKFPVFIYGWPKLFSQFGSMQCVGKCKTGMIRLNVTIPSGPQYAAGNTQLDIWGKVLFHGKCQIGSGNKINVGEYGVLELGDDTKITSFCNITAYSKIFLGAHSWIVHRCQVFDTNFHYIADFNRHYIRKRSKPISIGNYCWICNSSTITGGAVIPDKTIVASNSLVGKDFSEIPSESIIGGIPAKFISTGHRKVESSQLIKQLYKFFLENPQATFFQLERDVDHTICDFK